MGLFLLSLKLLCSAFGILLLLRAYMRYLCMPSNDPLNAFTTSLTSMPVNIAASFIKRRANIDYPALFVAYLVAVVYEFFNGLFGYSGFGFLSIFGGAVILLLYWCVEFLMWCTFFFCIMSWINPTGQAYRTMGFLCYPVLAPFKKFIPTWRNIDFSAIGFFIVANIVLAFLSPYT